LKALKLAAPGIGTSDSSEIGVKDLLQKLIFPEGILFDRKKRHFDPLKPISFFS